MEEQLKKTLQPLREFWAKQAPKKKKMLLLSAAGVVLFALAAVAFLNQQGGQLATLYTSLERQEATDVYAMLQEMEVPAQMDGNGNVLVPKDVVDTVRLDLASKGYPKSGLSYDIFSSANGLTTTESDKKVILSQQLEVRQQDTLARIDGVSKAVVTLNLANSNNYVWEQDTSTSTAAVLLTLVPGTELSKAQVSAIKLIVSSGAPKMLPENVTVVDAATSMELKTEEETAGGLTGELERLGFERQIEKGMEEKAQKQLSLFYPPDQQRISATVVINYDKMVSESMQYKPTDQNNTGVIDSLQEQYAKNATNYAQGIAGEQPNTDVPQIVDMNGDGTPEYVDHSRTIDYAISYIKQQVEKGKAELTSSSIAVMIKDANLTQEKKDSIIEQISKATGITAGSISVATLEAPVEPGDGTQTATGNGIFDDPVLLAVIGFGVLALLVVIILVVRMLRKKKPTVEEVDELAMEQKRIQQEMDDKKRLLREAAEAKSSQENSIANDVRTFAKENPEITAGLIRSWLKEDE